MKSDTDVGDAKPSWSVERLGMPLPMVAGMLVFAVIQTGGFMLWLGELSSDVHTVLRNQDRGESQVYQLKDAQRDFALRDQAHDQLEKRVSQLEQNDGRRR